MKIRWGVIGCGGIARRRTIPGLCAAENAELVAVMDTNGAFAEEVKAEFGAKYAFTEIEPLLALAEIDAVYIATPVFCHKEQVIMAADAGKHILLEKPIATTEEGCERILSVAKKCGRKVIVCHVLRYTPFYTQIKQIIQSGELGDILAVYTSENVGYYHQAHSFVRGPWGNKEKSSPMILAKCCHDMDLLSWLIDKKCEKVASFGSLSYFKQENAPKNCANYCSDCSVDCMYRAQDLYKKYRWTAGYFSQEKDFRKIKKDLVHTQYDRCVFRSDNDVVDHQVCIFTFEGGITASHTMDAFSDKIYRDIKIHGTKAELFGIMEQNLLEIRPFGKKVKRITIDKGKTASGHGGGDDGIMNELYNAYNGLPTERITHIDSSMQSHKMAFAAEKARITESVIELK